MSIRFLQYLIYGVVLGLAVEGQAQTTYIVPKVGVSLSNFRFGETLNDGYDAGIKPGLVAGLAVDIPLLGGLRLQPEVLYVQKGSLQDSELGAPWGEIEFTDGSSRYVYDNLDERLHYLEVPLLLKYEFVGGRFGFHLLGGAALSLGLSGKLKRTLVDREGNPYFSELDKTYNSYYQDEYDRPTSFDMEFGDSESDTYHPLDIGVAFGGGTYIQVGAGRAILGARYVLGLSNMFIDDSREQKNNSLQISLGYAIPLRSY